MKDTPCRYCHGRGREVHRNEAGATLTTECTSCNGTGLDGDPRFLFWFIVVAFLAVMALVVWLSLGR